MAVNPVVNLPKGYQIRVKHAVTSEQKKYLLTLSGDLEFQETNILHPHVVLHYERAIAESVLLSRMRDFGIRSLIDVGGNASRTMGPARHYKMEYHSCSPVLSAADIMRAARLSMSRRSAEASAHTCHNVASECGVQADALLFIHSLYYFQPYELAELLINRSTTRTAFAVVNEFAGFGGEMPSAKGGLAESTWARSPDGEITHSVNGNVTPYVHGNVDWLHRGVSHFIFGDRNYTLAWDKFTFCGVSSLYWFKLVDGSVGPAPRHFINAETLECYTAPLKGLYTLEEVVALPFGIKLRFDRYQVYLNAELVDNARVQAMTWSFGKTQFKDSWWKLVCYVRKQVRDKMTMPINQQFFSILFTCAIVVVENRPMLNVLSVVGTHQMSLNELTRLVSGDFEESLWARFWSFFALVFEGPTLVSSSSVQPVAEPMRIAERPASKYSPPVQEQKPVAAKGGVSEYKTQVGKLTGPSVVETTDKPASDTLIVADNTKCNSVANDIAGLIDAVQRRLGKGLEGSPNFPAKMALRVLNRLVRREETIERDGYSMEDFEAWVTTEFGRRAEPKRVAVMRAAWQEFMVSGKLPEPEMTAFVKDEVYLKKVDKTRLICSPGPSYLAVFGTLFSLVGKRLKNQWNDQNWLWWATETTPIKLGAWFKRVKAELGDDSILLENDFKEFEARITRECLSLESVAHHLLGLNKQGKALFDKQRKLKVSGARGAVKFVRDGGRASGVPNTSAGNSLLNAIFHVTYWACLACRNADDDLAPVVLENCLQKIEREVRMIVLGDDNFAVLSRQFKWWWEAQTGDQMVEDISHWFEHNPGWKSELKLTPMKDYQKAEFCSGTFAAFQDENGEEQFCWVLKPGRTLLKAFNVKPTEPNAWGVLRGIALGILAYPQHPLLVKVCDLIVARSQGVPESEIYMREWDPQSNLSDTTVAQNWKWDTLNTSVRYDVEHQSIMAAAEALVGIMNGTTDLKVSIKSEGPLGVMLKADAEDLFDEDEEKSVNIMQRWPNMSAYMNAVPQAVNPIPPVDQAVQANKERKGKKPKQVNGPKKGPYGLRQ
jgi:hypothetical protein